MIDAYEYRDFVLFLRIKDFIFCSFYLLITTNSSPRF
nr:MAG TPA: hypothetical protein [Caudoviricetes sp.]